MRKQPKPKENIFDEKLIAELKEKKKSFAFYSKNYYPGGKRLADVVIGFFVLAVFMILFPFVAVAIKLDSKGPIFFAQARVGMYGHVFKIYKLRTMCVNAEDLIAHEAVGEDGALLVRTPDGALRRFLVGDVTLARPAAE